jgi:hypothetical protein
MTEFILSVALVTRWGYYIPLLSLFEKTRQ